MSSSISIIEYYVYFLLDELGVPFYVGKGHGNRIDSHEREARRGVNEPRHKKIRSIWRRNSSVGKEIVFRTQCEQEAFDMEKDLISVLGRKNLCNCMDGGEGPSGPKHSRQHIEALRARMLGNKYRLGIPFVKTSAWIEGYRKVDWSAVGHKRWATLRKRGQGGKSESTKGKFRLRPNPRGVSGVTGVFPNTGSRYFVRVYRDMKPIYLGNYKTLSEAAAVRCTVLNGDGTINEPELLRIRGGIRARRVRKV